MSGLMLFSDDSPTLSAYFASTHDPYLLLSPMMATPYTLGRFRWWVGQEAATVSPRGGLSS
jgi:hypothetical protein